MKSRLLRNRFIWIVTALIVMAVFFAALLFSTGEKSDITDEEVRQGIDTQKVSRRDFNSTADWIGVVESAGSVKIVALGRGRITAVRARVGTRVRKGDPLFEVGGPVLDAKKEAVLATVSSLKNRLSLAGEVVKRKREAARTKVVSENELADAISKEQDLSARLKAAEAAEGELDAQTIVRSPEDGIFTDRVVNVGQDVDKGALLGRLVDPVRLRIVATVFPSVHDKLKGRQAGVWMAKDVTIGALVAKVFPDKTAEGGTVVWIKGSKLQKHLSVGEHVRGYVLLDVHRKALAVPRRAVVYDDNERPCVFVKKGGRFVKTAVELGLGSPGWKEVTKGLAPDDAVVVNGAYELFYKDYSKTYKVED